MKSRKKILIGVVSLIIIFIILVLSGVAKVNLKRRAVYASCNSGCDSNLNDMTDCIGFLSYLKSNEPGFVSTAKKMNVNIDKPDEYKKTVSADGNIKCWYYSN